MKKRGEKGITLLTLVIFLVIITIIAGISIDTGIGTIASAKYMSFQSELGLVQSKVNEVTAQYQSENKTIGESVVEPESEILETEEVGTILQQKAASTGLTLKEIKDGFRLCSKKYMAQEFGLENLERNYLINLQISTVVALEKCQYEGVNYYMLEQIENGLYNVTYNSQITSEGSFKVNTRQVAQGYEVKIIPEHDKYVSKWEISYKLQKDSQWKKEDSLTFYVDTPGIYEIQVKHGDEVNLKKQIVTIKAGEQDENGYYTRSNTINGRTNSTTYNPVIPKGFKPLEDATTANAMWGDGSSAPTREAVNSGLVIEAKDGSQYVWVPVDETEVKLNRHTFDERGNATIHGESTLTIGEYQYEEMKIQSSGNIIANKIDEFRQSVQKNGGYYIARYEASKGENNKALSIASQGSPVGNSGTSEDVKAKMLWNWVTQEEADTACQSLYAEIKSDLINSYAWDTAIIFIQKNDDDIYSQKKGNNYSNSLQNTGASTDKACNIYDMAANCFEWTTETCKIEQYPCVYRGGVLGDGSSTASSRGYNSSVSDRNYNISFRPILYW